MSLPEPSLFDSFSGKIDTARCAHGRLPHERCPFCDPLPPAQRHSPTSVAAAEAIAPDQNTVRERVYRCILTDGPITDEGIANKLSMNPSTARPRRVELVDAGRVVAAGKSHTASGRSAVAWKVAR